jgi:hypothetical protein
MVTYSTHVIVLFLLYSLLAVNPPHPLDELIQHKRRAVINLRRDVSSNLQEKLMVDWQRDVSGCLHSNISFAPPIVVHAELLKIVLRWCKPFLLYIHCWCKPFTPCRQRKPSAHNVFSWMGDTCKKKEDRQRFSFNSQSQLSSGFLSNI